MTLDEVNITVEYLKEMQEGYIEGEGCECIVNEEKKSAEKGGK